jgi:hypothetical protein
MFIHSSYYEPESYVKSEKIDSNPGKRGRVCFSSPAFFGTWGIFHQWSEVLCDDTWVDEFR